MEDILSQVFITAITIVAMVILTLIIYYIFSRKMYNQNKEQFKQVHMELSKGRKVEFSNGLIGHIKAVGDEYCDIEIKSGAVITVSRFAITRFVD